MNCNRSDVYICIIETTVFRMTRQYYWNCLASKKEVISRKKSLLYNFCYWKTSIQFTVFQCTNVYIIHCNNLIVQRVYKMSEGNTSIKNLKNIFLYIFGYQSEIMNISSVLLNTKDYWYTQMKLLYEYILKIILHMQCCFLKSSLILK